MAFDRTSEWSTEPACALARDLVIVGEILSCGAVLGPSATESGFVDRHADGRAAAREPPVVDLEDSRVRSLRRLPEPSCSEALVEEH